MLARFIKSALAPVPRLPVVELWGFKKFLLNYLLVFLYFVAGTLAPVSIFSLYVWVTIEWIPELKHLLPASDEVVMTALLITSFLGGFGAAAWRINRFFKDDGRSLVKTLRLSLNGLSVFQVLSRAALALAIAIALEILVKLALPFEADDRAANFIESLAGNVYALTAFILLAVVGAGILEELLFRGFVLNTLRHRFRSSGLFRVFGNNEHIADYAAVSLSALIFAVGHLSPTAIPALFVVGFVMGELYRRTGSLICPMIAHAGNNYIAISLVLWSMA